jgi:hypothetical protein
MPAPSRKSVPKLLLLLSLLAYGILIPWLGFYWDDWAFAWIGKFLGSAEFIPAFRPFRPFIAPYFVLTTGVLPEIPALWQTLGLLVRFASALAAWWALNQIWLGQKRNNLTVTLLFLLYPGYSQQWVALTHINQEWLSLIAYLLSFGYTAQAVRTPQHAKRKTALSLLFLFWGLFPTEYFISLEPLRFLFLYIILAEEKKPFREHLKKTITHWIPYLALWLTNALWLVFYYTKGGYASYRIGATSHLSPTQLLRESGTLLYITLWKIWTQFLRDFADNPAAPTALLGLALVVFTFFLLSIYFQKTDPRLSSASKNKWASQTFSIGLVGLFLGRIPSWLANLPLKTGTTFDRLTISLIFASALLIAGLLNLVIKNPQRREIILSGILALALGQQFFNANEFRRDWERQRDLLWQLTWRIPAMDTGTALVTHQLPMIYESDQAFTAPLNWIYAPDYRAGNLLPYAFVNTEKRLGGYSLPSLNPDTPINVPYRTVHFEGSTSAMIVIYAPKNGCLRVLDPIYANAQTYNKESDYLKKAIPLSDPNRIHTEATSPIPPAAVFGKEPAHEWCYYYTRAELARQKADWETVADLGNQAETRGFAPRDSFEWLPFIEAYAYTDQADKASKISADALRAEPRLRKGLCQLWERISQDSQLENRAKKMQNEMNCPQ